MFKRRDNSLTTRVDTLLGRTVNVHGDVEFSGGLHIDGTIHGCVRAVPGNEASIAVSEQAVIHGSLEAPQVVMNGAIMGDIIASHRVVLGPKARVQGDVYYGTIEMALGAQVNGKLVLRGAEGQSQHNDGALGSSLGSSRGAPAGLLGSVAE